MKTYCFTVDDNIRVLKELTEERPESIFCHPYLAMYRRLHEKFGLKVQLNLFYEMEGFDLSMMTDAYRSKWEANAHWLKMSFHSKWENVRPYEFSGYDEVSSDCRAVHEQIVRFASPSALARTTTVHYCRTTEEGLQALKDAGMKGLLGLFDTDENPRTSYSVPETYGPAIRAGAVAEHLGVKIAAIDMILNLFPLAKITSTLEDFLSHQQIRVMIHEQYFYSDYPAYQVDFEQKLTETFAFLEGHGYESRFFEEMMDQED